MHQTQKPGKGLGKTLPEHKILSLGNRTVFSVITAHCPTFYQPSERSSPFYITTVVSLLVLGRQVSLSWNDLKLFSCFAYVHLKYKEAVLRIRPNSFIFLGREIGSYSFFYFSAHITDRATFFSSLASFPALQFLGIWLTGQAQENVHSFELPGDGAQWLFSESDTSTAGPWNVRNNLSRINMDACMTLI